MIGKALGFLGAPNILPWVLLGVVVMTGAAWAHGNWTGYDNGYTQADNKWQEAKNSALEDLAQNILDQVTAANAALEIEQRERNEDRDLLNQTYLEVSRNAEDLPACDGTIKLSELFNTILSRAGALPNPRDIQPALRPSPTLTD